MLNTASEAAQPWSPGSHINGFNKHQPAALVHPSDIVTGQLQVHVVIQRCSDCQNAYVRHANAKSFPPTQLTVNKTAGVAANAAAVQPATASHARYLITCSITTTDGQHNRTGGPGGVAQS
jgi:hypothetical protein